MPIKVRVGQTEAVKILSSKGGGSVATQNAVNVIGGIASVSQLSVTGISTVGNLNITGIATGTFIGNLTGNITGNVSGSSGSCSGNSLTASTLESSRDIGGVAFNGSSDINLPGVNISGNQDTSGNAGTATSLATARNIGGVLFDGTSSINLPGVNISGNQNTSGTASGLSGTPNISINNIVGTAATFSGDVIIAGELTYEDVTNIDSVGLVTARSGLRVNNGGLIITSGISTFSGIATFTNDVFVDGTLTAGIIDGGVF